MKAITENRRPDNPTNGRKVSLTVYMFQRKIFEIYLTSCIQK